MQYTIATTLALAGSAVATYAAAAAPVIHQVSVSNANGDLTFTPNDFTAAKGDFVEFTFNPKNHSVAQSNFANPCLPIDQSVPAHGPGFFSGYMPVTAGESPMKTFAIEVTDVSKPIWFYCSQGRHCQSGMVGVINATPQQTLAGFQQLAKNVSVNTPPRQIFGGVDLNTNTNTNWNTTTTTTYENTYTSSVEVLTTLETAWTVSDSSVTTTVTAPLATYTSYTSSGSSDTGSTGSTDTGSTGSSDTGSSGSSDTGSTGSTDTGSTGTASTTSSTVNGSDLTTGIAQSNSASGLVGSSPLSLLGLVAAGVYFFA